MSTALNEMQFELLPSVDADAGVVFGIGADISMDDGGFIPGDDDWEAEDETNPRRGGVAFGRELLKGPVDGYNLHVDQTDVKTARAALSAIRTAWRAAHIRDTPGAVVVIRYRLDDEIRRMYGRPRRFSAPPDNKILGGFIPITADFQRVDNFTYDDVEQNVILGLNPGGSEGGFTFPLTFPIATLPVGLSQQQAVVGGDAPTFPLIRFDGPVLNPSLETADWSLRLNREIQAGEYVEIDLRPWGGISVMLNGTASVAGDLGLRTRLSDLKFQPGRHDLTFRGSSASGSATCEVRWSNAHNSI